LGGATSVAVTGAACVAVKWTKALRKPRLVIEWIIVLTFEIERLQLALYVGGDNLPLIQVQARTEMKKGETLFQE
jgi:hypothetical protein